MKCRKRTFDPATFDRERGDTLTIPRELFVPLAQLPFNYAGPIIHALLRWAAGADEDEVRMDDPRDQMFLAQLIEHQKTNAGNYYLRQMEQRESASKAGKASAAKRATERNARQRPSTEVNQDKDKEEDKDPEGEGLYSSSFPGEPGAATPSAGGPCVNAAPDEVATVYPYSDTPPIAIAHTDLQKDPVGTMLDFLRPTEDERARTQNTLAARMREAGRETFDAVCWKFLKEAETATTRQKEANAWIRAQMTKEGIGETETFLDKHPKAKTRWESIRAAADTFDPEDGAAKTLFGRLKAYKPTTDRQTKKGGEE